MGDSGERAVLCPRCGYDQRGIVATWRESCPLQSTCAECGLVYRCAEVICPDKFAPSWCVEYARGRWQWIASFFKTAAMQLVPWKFWQRLSMHHEPRFGRIATYIVLAILTLYPALMVSQGIAAWKLYNFQLIVQPNPMQGQQLQVAQPPPPPVISVWHAVAWSAVMPLSSSSPGNYMFGGTFWTPFPAPSDLLIRTWHPRRNGLMVGMMMLFWFTLLVCKPLSFVLLPQTLRAAKVRWVHIARIGLYPAVFTIPLLWFVAIFQVQYFSIPQMLSVSGISIAWWGFACHYYLKLPRSWFVVVVLTIMLLLVAVAIQYFFLRESFLTQVLRWS